jgi:predicted phosphoribosyltransferase
MWADRVDAGRALAPSLKRETESGAVIVGIPRGGVIVAAEAARLLKAKLDIVITRKLASPGNPEFGIGAIAPDGETVIDDEIAAYVGATPAYIEKEKDTQLAELRRREEKYRKFAPRVDWTGLTVILVDDGIATGVTIKAAAEYARRQGAARVVIAAPVAPSDAVGRLGKAADAYIFLETPVYFNAVGAFYRNFTQTTDEEVEAALTAS